jgi:glycerol-3-phosphate dehydrogenase
MNRQIILKHIQDHPEKIWDVVVIGGGATGLGIALDSATRGYSTLLLEQSDFAKATSSRSTKLVHGGVRYMAQGDLLLVREALQERGILMKNAPHLTFNQEFIIPVYTNFDVLKFTLGLKFYDLLAGRLSLGKSYFIGSSETIRRMPLLRKKGLKGGVVYHDGQFDDSRLAVALAVQTVSNGGSVLNYMSAAGFIKNSEGMITGVKAIDQLSGAGILLNSRVVINATGVFADSITRMDDKDSTPSLKPSQGVHIVLDKSFLQSDSAIMIPKTDDGRVLFAIPWYDEIVVGTTDTPVDDIALEPVALEKEINFILKTAGDYLEKKPARSDVLSIFAGLRPLAADPENPGSTKEVSRRHKITVSSSGLISIVGGKWTTYRKMAQETIDKATKMGLLDPRECVTKDYNLTNGAVIIAGRLSVYGKGGSEILRIIKEDPVSGTPLDSSLPYTAAEIIWICRNEMPFELEDILARRTRALFLNARASLRIAPLVAEIMMKESGFTSQWRDDQLVSYTNLVSRYI